MMKVGFLNTEKLLVSRAKGKTQCVHNRCFSGVILSDNGCQTRVQLDSESITAFAKSSEIFNAKQRQKHLNKARP